MTHTAVAVFTVAIWRTGAREESGCYFGMVHAVTTLMTVR